MRYSRYCTKTGWGDSIVAVKRGNIWFPVALFHWLLQHSCWQRQQRWIIKHQTLIFDQEGRLTQAGEMKRMFWHRTLKIWTKSLMSQAPPTKPLQGANQAHSQGWYHRVWGLMWNFLYWGKKHFLIDKCISNNFKQSYSVSGEIASPSSSAAKNSPQTKPLFLSAGVTLVRQTLFHLHREMIYPSLGDEASARFLFFCDLLWKIFFSLSSPSSAKQAESHRREVWRHYMFSRVNGWALILGFVYAVRRRKTLSFTKTPAYRLVSSHRRGRRPSSWPPF